MAWRIVIYLNLLDHAIMKYGTQTRLKSLLPPLQSTAGAEKYLSQKAKIRLKWMRYIEQGHSVIECSRHFDYPERTIRYWRRRYNPNDITSLKDRSRRPNNVRKSTVKQAHIEMVIQLRKKFPSFGKEKIQVLLKKRGVYIGQSRIQKIINSAGLKRKYIYKKRIYSNLYYYKKIQKKAFFTK